jgi:CheY-like chemotaxis protein
MHVTDSPMRDTSNTVEGIMGTTSTPPRRILVIDDELGVRETLVHLLRALGYDVIEAEGGRAGLARLAEGAVDLVLTDLGMPDVNGWDVARAVKARARRPFAGGGGLVEAVSRAGHREGRRARTRGGRRTRRQPECYAAGPGSRRHRVSRCRSALRVCQSHGTVPRVLLAPSLFNIRVANR